MSEASLFGDPEAVAYAPPPITAILPYFGAKRTLAGRIVAEAGKHSVWWEPFCGSLAVTLSKPPCRQETVNDLYGDVVNLARVLADREQAEQMYARLYPIIPGQMMHKEAKARLVEDSWPDMEPWNVNRAVDFFVASWLGRNGMIGTKQFNNNFCARYTANGGSPARRWQSAVDAIPEWHERLRNVVILSECGLKLCERIDDEAGTVIYCDPPYLVKGASYVHDFTPEGHRRLAESLRRFKPARVMVSYYDHPDLAELYPGWRKIDLAVMKSLVNQGRRATGAGAVKAAEVLLCNWG